MDETTTLTDGSGPLTVVAAWTIKPGMEAAFEQWHQGIAAQAARFPGYMGNIVMRPGEAAGEYLAIYRFDSLAHLLAWETSPERSEWLRRAESLRLSPILYRKGYGLDFWFASSRAAGPPPRWKMALVRSLPSTSSSTSSGSSLRRFSAAKLPGLSASWKRRSSWGL